MKNKHIESIRKKLTSSQEEVIKNKSINGYDISDIYNVYIEQDDRYANNFFVRAPDKKTAYRIALNEIDPMGEVTKKSISSINLKDNYDVNADMLITLFRDGDDDELMELLEGKTDCYYYDSGT